MQNKDNREKNLKWFKNLSVEEQMGLIEVES